jgi:HAMP domain-containing protein
MSEYTVMLRQSPTDPAVLGELVIQLQRGFHLSESQAHRLATRPPGPLLKPTTQAKAQRVFDLYRSLGIAVDLTPCAAQEISGVASSAAQAASPPQGLTPPPAAPPTPPPAAEPSPPAAPEQPAPAAPSVTATSALEEPERARRRGSLRPRLLLGTLTPLILLGVAIVLVLIFTLPPTLNRITRTSATELASVATRSVNFADPTAINTELSLLTQEKGVGFVLVKTPLATYFRSVHPNNDWWIGAQVQRFLAAHPTARQFSWRNDLTSVYQRLLAQNTAALAPQVRQHIASQAARLSKGQGQVLHFALSTVAQPSSPGDVVTVGVLTNSSLDAVRRLTLLIAAVVVVGVLIAALILSVVASQLLRPIVQLSRVADQISLGKLEQPIEMNRNDEIGQLAESLERMRISLLAALERLRRRRR